MKAQSFDGVWSVGLFPFAEKIKELKKETDASTPLVVDIGGGAGHTSAKIRELCKVSQLSLTSFHDVKDWVPIQTASSQPLWIFWTSVCSCPQFEALEEGRGQGSYWAIHNPKRGTFKVILCTDSVLESRKSTERLFCKTSQRSLTMSCRQRVLYPWHMTFSRSSLSKVSSCAAQPGAKCQVHKLIKTLLRPSRCSNILPKTHPTRLGGPQQRGHSQAHCRRHGPRATEPVGDSGADLAYPGRQQRERPGGCTDDDLHGHGADGKAMGGAAGPGWSEGGANSQSARDAVRSCRSSLSLRRPLDRRLGRGEGQLEGTKDARLWQT